MEIERETGVAGPLKLVRDLESGTAPLPKKRPRGDGSPSPVPVAGQEKDRKISRSQLLLDLAQDVELFHSPVGDAYATFPLDKGNATSAIEDSRFKDFLRRRYFEDCGSAVQAHALREALATLSARAQFDGETKKVFTRVGRTGGAIYIDLGDDSWRAVEITAAGWRIVADPPVKFVRCGGQQPLPEPVAGGAVEELEELLNLPADGGLTLVVGWLVQAIRPESKYPPLLLQGEQGSGKSMLAGFLKRMVDPHSTLLRSPPQCERDLAASATNCWVLAYNNLSGVAPWLSDALCRLATEGGYAARRLHTNGTEFTVDRTMPVILNGIADIATRHDLQDRSIVLHLPTIGEQRRMPEGEVERRFREALPRVLGALYAGVASALRNEGAVKLPSLSRMAGFDIWTEASAEGFGWEPGRFQEAFRLNRRNAAEVALENDPVATAIRSLMRDRLEWSGTMEALFADLSARLTPCQRRSWGANPRWLSNGILRCIPSLRTVGISVERRGRYANTSVRGVEITRAGSGTLATCRTCPDPHLEDLAGQSHPAGEEG